VENLVGYAKADLMVPQAPFGDLAAANAAAAAWCAEVNGVVHSEICAVPAEQLVMWLSGGRAVWWQVFFGSLGIALPMSRPYQTCAGFLLQEFAAIPDVGHKVSVRDWRFEIVDMDGRRIDKVMVSRKPALLALCARTYPVTAAGMVIGRSR
jgi:hypothetical protein